MKAKNKTEDNEVALDNYLQNQNRERDPLTTPLYYNDTDIELVL